MDCDPPDHIQMSCPMIKLQSSDGVTFQVEVKVARLSLHLKGMMDDLGVEENEVISIPQNGPNISGAILEKIIQWAKHHKDDPGAAEDDKNEVKQTDDMSSWDAEFLELDPTTLVHIIRAANYLDIEGLLNVTCKKVAKMIKGMTAEKVRQTFGIQNDFSPAEEKQVHSENMLCEGFDSKVYDHGEFWRSWDARFVDAIPANSVQNMDMEVIDNGDRGEIEECLNISIVAREIFQHFSDAELLKLSFVNKQWNYEARSVIKERGNLFAYVRCTGRANEWTQGNVAVFLAATRRMNIVPFSEIKILLHNHQNSEAFTNEAPDPINDANLNHLQLKKLSFQCFGANNACSGLLLAKKLCQDFSEVLEALSFDIYTDKQNLVEDVIQECRFPLLKVLELRKDYNHSDLTYMSDIKELVSRAPTLQELHATWPIESVLNSLEGSSAVIVYKPTVRAPFSEIPQSAIGRLRLKSVELFYTGYQFNLERMSQFTPVLLKDSCTTISSMSIDTVLAVPLMCYGVCLEKVESLSIHLNYRQLELLEPRILEIVKQFDFTRVFPNLKKVQIWRSFAMPSLDHMNGIVEHANAVLPDPTPNRAVYVKELYLSKCYLSNAIVPFLAEMFPCIEKLQVSVELGEEFSYWALWEHWTNLKDFQVSGDIIPNSGNLDSVFCGIFPEEIAELRQKDDEYLKTVHIVPVMPAITCLKSLKRLYLSHYTQRVWTDVDDGTLMFSKVTGWIAFARCPTLVDITLNIQVRPAIAANHMKPFANINKW